MNNLSASKPTDQCLARLEKERARKRAKRACESSVERNRRKQSNRVRNQHYRSSECLQHRRASESEAQHEQRLAAGQQ